MINVIIIIKVLFCGIDMKRRDFLLTTSGAFGLGYLGSTVFPQARASLSDSVHWLEIQKARYQFREQVTEDIISLSKDSPPPVITAKQGEPISLTVKNSLVNEYTAMHWHGIRLDNAMDGVPYLTQMPIAEGESFDYRFTPPDAGTYWYHPHCMTMTQMARGLTGVLVVKEKHEPDFDGDQVINLRDFRLDKDDVFRVPYSLRAAARGGTLGNVMTANWQQKPVYEYPSGSIVRLRLANTDTARIYKLYFNSKNGIILAWDGHPVEEKIPMPGADQPLLLSPGQRVDIAMLMPESEGQTLDLIAIVPGGDRILAQLHSRGQSFKRELLDVKPLAPNPLLVPDLKQAQMHEFVFGWSPDGSAPNNGFCGSIGKNFWSINRLAWQGDNAVNLSPLATLALGKSYILRFRNESPNMHPVHLHGLTFKPIRSNRRTLPSNWTDTVLLLKNEVIDVVMVADNPGKWAFHCHVIEHQKTGLAGYITIDA